MINFPHILQSADAQRKKFHAIIVSASCFVSSAILLLVFFVKFYRVAKIVDTPTEVVIKKISKQELV